jgi:hypothetical protein
MTELAGPFISHQIKLNKFSKLIGTAGWIRTVDLLIHSCMF